MNSLPGFNWGIIASTALMALESQNTTARVDRANKMREAEIARRARERTSSAVLVSYKTMTPQPPKIQLTNASDYREAYANSVQIRVNLWDFFLLFGVVNQTAPDQVSIQNFQGIYVSPQQAKALLNVLQQNVSQYENTFGEIR